MNKTIKLETASQLRSWEKRHAVILNGYIDGANGYRAREGPEEFVPTRAELLQLVKHWGLNNLRHAYFTFCTRQVRRDDTRLLLFTLRRVMRIMEPHTDDAILAVVEEWDAFAKSIGTRKWSIIGLLGQDAIQAVAEEWDAFAKCIGPRKWKKFCIYLGPDLLHEGLIAFGKWLEETARAGQATDAEQ